MIHPRRRLPSFARLILQGAFMSRIGLCLFVAVGLLVAGARESRSQTGSSSVNPAHEKLKSQADQAYRQGKYSEAVKLMNSVIRQNPRDAVAHYLRGSSRIELAMRKQDAKAMRGGIGDAREAIRLDAAKNPMYYLPYLYGMTNLTVIEGKPQHAKVAVSFADQLLQKAPLTTEMKANVHYQRGNANVALNKTDDAVQDFQSAIRFNGKHLGAHMGAADALARAGKMQKAELQYETAVATFPKNPLVYNNRGMFLQQIGKYDEAIESFTKCLSLDRNYVFAYTNRGFAQLQKGKPAEAEADFTRSLTTDSNQPSVYSLRATSRVAQGKLKEAAQDNRMVVKLTPKNPTSHAELGFTHMFAGNFKEADAAFSQSLALNPKQPHLAPWVFLSRELTGKKEEALAAFKEILDKKPAERKWVDSVVAYLAGKIDASALLRAVDSKNAAAKKAQLCEAHYFIGLRKYDSEGATAAKVHFKKAVDSGQRQLSAFHAARLALHRLDTAKE